MTDESRARSLVPQTPVEIAQITARTITVSEAAHIAGVTGKTIREWATKIDGLGVKRVGRWAIKKNNLMVILEVGVERYLERLAAARAKREQMNRTHAAN